MRALMRCAVVAAFNIRRTCWSRMERAPTPVRCINPYSSWSHFKLFRFLAALTMNRLHRAARPVQVMRLVASGEGLQPGSPGAESLPATAFTPGGASTLSSLRGSAAGATPATGGPLALSLTVSEAQSVGEESEAALSGGGSSGDVSLGGMSPVMLQPSLQVGGLSKTI